METAQPSPNGKRRHLKKRAFLAAFAECGNVTEAARLAETDRNNHYQWLKKDPAYEAAFQAAEAEAADRLELEARRRAAEGWLEPVFWQGEPVSVIRKFSDTLLIFLLKGARPQKFRDNQHVEHTGAGGGPVLLNVVRNTPGQGATDEPSP